MNKIFIGLQVLIISVCSVESSSQPAGEWTWMGGDSTFSSVPVYGVQGIPDPANQPGGLYEATEWVDLSGNFYLYGGLNSNNETQADLWKYDPVTYQWTWLNGPGGTGLPVFGTLGISDPTNQPGDRGYGILSWVDGSNNLWMYGGYSNTRNSYLGDLWKYDVAINEWTWMSGDSAAGSTGYHGVMGVPSPLNVPANNGENACAWTEGNNLWFYGGWSFGQCIGDLWRYNITTNEWTWMKGDTAYNASPVYGTLGVSSPANFPGARRCYSRWIDSNNNLWIFGGTIQTSDRNDLWRYEIFTNEWTWMSGSNSGFDPGSYGTQCVPAASNQPPARIEARTAWTDECDIFWLFGGGIPLGVGNDLWKYDVSTGMWTWVSGSSVAASPPVFGNKGVSAPGNVPAGRSGANPFRDLSGNLWLTGGLNYGAWLLNDLWRYVPDPACGACASIPVAQFDAPDSACPGTCLDFTNQSTAATSYEWNFPGGIPSASSDVNPANICYNTPGAYDVQLIATSLTGSDTLTLTNFITVFPFPPPQGIQQSGDTLFANPGSASYQWYYNGNLIGGATDYYYVALATGDYNVVATDTNGCEVEAAIFDVIAGLHSAATGFKLSVFPNPAEKTLGIKILLNGENKIEKDAIKIYNLLGVSQDCIFIIDEKQSGCMADISPLPAGLYWVELTIGKKILRKPFLKSSNY